MWWLMFICTALGFGSLGFLLGAAWVAAHAYDRDDPWTDGLYTREPTDD